MSVSGPAFKHPPYPNLTDPEKSSEETINSDFDQVSLIIVLAFEALTSSGLRNISDGVNAARRGRLLEYTIK